MPGDFKASFVGVGELLDGEWLAQLAAAVSEGDLTLMTNESPFLTSQVKGYMH